MMMNSFALDDRGIMFQTSNFPSQQQHRNYSSDKENIIPNNTERQLLSNQSGLTILQELGETVKTDITIVEEGLTLFERLNHHKWQIRRKTYQELILLFQTEGCPEFQQSWFKNIINDKHEFAFLEGLNLLSVYLQQHKYTNNLAYFIPDLLEKGSFLKNNQQCHVINILMLCLNNPHECQFITQEIFRKIESKHPKVVLFNLQILVKILQKCDPHAETIRITFKSMITLLKHTNKEIRSIAIKVFASAYSCVNESFEELKKLYLNNQRELQLKELNQACTKSGKRVGTKISIGEQQQPQKLVGDLLSLIPEKFFELPYMTQPSERRKKIEEFALKMEAFINKKGIIESHKDYGTVFGIVLSLLEESNYLIYSEAMRCVRCIAKLLQRNLQPVIAKHFFHAVLDKLKGALSKALQSTVFSVLEDLMIFEALSVDNFLEMMMTEIDAGKHMGVRIGCLKWLKEGWCALAIAIQSGSTPDDGSQFAKFIKRNRDKVIKSMVVIRHKVNEVYRKENNINFRQACSYLLDGLNDEQPAMSQTYQQPTQQHPQNHKRNKSFDPTSPQRTQQSDASEYCQLRSHSAKKSQISEFETPKTKKSHQSGNTHSSNSNTSGNRQTVPYDSVKVGLIQQSHSPGGHWRRGIGRDNMVISESRDSWKNDEIRTEQYQRFIKLVDLHECLFNDGIEFKPPPINLLEDVQPTPLSQTQSRTSQQSLQLHQLNQQRYGLHQQSSSLQLPPTPQYSTLQSNSSPVQNFNLLQLPQITTQSVSSYASNPIVQQSVQQSNPNNIPNKPQQPQQQTHQNQFLQPPLQLNALSTLQSQQSLSSNQNTIESPRDHKSNLNPQASFGSGQPKSQSINTQQTPHNNYTHFDNVPLTTPPQSAQSQIYQVNLGTPVDLQAKLDQVAHPPPQLQQQVSFGTTNKKQSLSSNDILALYKQHNKQTQEAALQENRSALTQVLEEQGICVRSVKRNESIRQLQEIILTSSSLYFDIANNLMANYDSLEDLDEKIGFIDDLQLSIINETLLENISESSYQAVLAIVIRLCTSPATQTEMFSSDESQLSSKLQLILDVLMKVRDTSKVVISLISIFNEHLPFDFNQELSKNDKVMLRLTIKCIETQISQAEDLDVFGILLQIYKFFKVHPPESLVEGIPSLKELEHYFRQMKALTDKVMLWSPVRAKEFVEYVHNARGKNIFLGYLKAQVDKMLTI